jgi:membrane glycosyltransferase
MQDHPRIRPSPQEIAAMEKVISWPAQYLSAEPKLMVAVNSVALAHALGRDAGWAAKERDGCADTWRQRHDRGCANIALGLVLDRVAVF